MMASKLLNTLHNPNNKPDTVMMAASTNKKILIDHKNLLDKLPTATICVSEPGEILFVNVAAVHLFQLEEKVLLTKPFVTRVSSEHTRKLSTFLYETRLNKNFECQIEIERRNGHKISTVLHSKPIFIDNEFQYSIINLIDISEQRQIQESLTRTKEELQYLAHHDQLTHLPNRYLLEDRLQNALFRTKRNGWYGAVIFVDVDRFKIINDDYGHHVGDEILRIISMRLKKAVREQDTVCRYSGDEFILVLEDITCQKDAENIIQKILSLFEPPIEGLIDSPLKVSTSIGVCLFDKYDSSTETLIKNADYAMYESKKSGRNCYTFYSAEHSIDENLYKIMENEISVAINEKQLQLYFQPQVNSHTNEIEGVEALTRWNHPGKGMIEPKDFIDRIEKAHLSSQLSQWVLNDACLKAKQWLENGYRFKYIAVNITPSELNSESFITTVKSALSQSGLPAHMLEIELTESSIIQNPIHANRILDDLRSMNVRLSLDDFGTGYSALSCLNDYPFTGIKIDRSFVEHLPYDKKSSALVDAIISIAQSIGIAVVAEGVELQEQRQYLADKNCYVLQGHLFSKAIDAKQIDNFFSCERLTQNRVINQTA